MKNRYVVVFRKDMWWRCWLTEFPYSRIGPFNNGVHRWCRSGEGELVRHLCGNSHCVNPLHHRRGTASENSKDRVEKDLWLKGFFYDMEYEIKVNILDMHKKTLERIPHGGIIDICDLLYGDRMAYRIRKLAEHGYVWKEQIEYAKEIFKTIINEDKFKLIIMEDYFNEYKRT